MRQIGESKRRRLSRWLQSALRRCRGLSHPRYCLSILLLTERRFYRRVLPPIGGPSGSYHFRASWVLLAASVVALDEVSVSVEWAGALAVVAMPGGVPVGAAPVVAWEGVLEAVAAVEAVAEVYFR